MDKKGLTFTAIFLAESANYGEGIGNVATLKKISRNRGEQYTYISRQAIRYNIVEQLGENKANVKAEGSGDKKVVQFSAETTIKDYPELDFFGYMKTVKGDNSKNRSAIVRLSNAVSLIENEEKARRVNKLLDTISLLYRDIRGRREDLKPLFIIGGVYDIKNPFFENVVDVRNNKILVEKLTSGIYDFIENDTAAGIVKEQFENDTELETELAKKNIKVLNVPEFFKQLKNKIGEYYTK